MSHESRQARPLRSKEFFPLDNPKAKIVVERGRIYICEREYYWDSEAQLGKESRMYLGRIVDGVFYTTEEYRQKFKRSGELRVVERPKNRPCRRKAEKVAKVEATLKATPETATVVADPAAAVPAEVLPLRLSTKRTGMTAIFYEFSRQIGLWEDVSTTFGNLAALVCVQLLIYRQ